MYLFLISFFISLFLISAMLGRKMLALKNKPIGNTYDFAIQVPDLDEVKFMANKNLRKYSYLALVLTLRSYLKTLNFLKMKYKVLEQRIKKMRGTEEEISASSEKKEANAFLKMIADYKKKVRKIKRKIKEEEGLN